MRIRKNYLALVLIPTILILGLTMLYTQNRKKTDLPKEIPLELQTDEMATVKVELNTTQGVIRLELWPDIAPKTVANFIKLAQEDYYNGTYFHRVIPDFMIQGGVQIPRTKIDRTTEPAAPATHLKMNAMQMVNCSPAKLKPTAEQKLCGQTSSCRICNKIEPRTKRSPLWLKNAKQHKALRRSKKRRLNTSWLLPISPNPSIPKCLEHRFSMAISPWQTAVPTQTAASFSSSPRKMEHLGSMVNIRYLGKSSPVWTSFMRSKTSPAMHVITPKLKTNHSSTAFHSQNKG